MSMLFQWIFRNRSSEYISAKAGFENKERFLKGYWKRQRELAKIKSDFRKRMDEILNEADKDS